MPYEPITNFKDDNGVDLGKKLITKDYLLSVYPSLLDTLAPGFNPTPSLWTWGLNDYGQLGVNDTTTRSTPVTTLIGGTNWKSIACGYRYTAAIKTDGTLWLWGINDSGQLGVNNTRHRSTPVTTLLGGTNWKSVSCRNHIAAIKTDGTLWSWGGNLNGQLGVNDIRTRSTPVTTLLGGTNWKSVVCGNNQTIALKTDGTLWTWGRNNFGQLGVNNTTSRSTPVTTLLGGTNWKSIGGGYNNTIALKTDGTLWVWGKNSYGELGLNNGPTSTPVTTILGGTNWKSVSPSPGIIVVKNDGTLWRFGSKSIPVDIKTPVTTLLGGTNWAYISPGDVTQSDSYFTITSFGAIKTDGTLWMWGGNSTGQLGVNDFFRRGYPVTTILGGTNWKSISGGMSCRNFAAIKTDGTLWTCGENSIGQLGVNDTVTRNTPVTTLLGGTNWKSVACGNNNTIALKTDGTLWGWGYNTFGQLGINDVFSKNTPVTTLLGGTNWDSISTTSHTAAIKTDGTLWIWGYNFAGQLGVNDTTQRNTPVTTLLGGTNWKSVACGNNHTIAIKTDGTLWSWGGNLNGQLGVNDIRTRSTPVTTLLGGNNWNFISVAGTEDNTAALKTDGTLWSWGRNSYGQLGVNDTTHRSTPVTTLLGGNNWKSVSSKTYTINDPNTKTGSIITAVKDDGTLWTWGSNYYGGLGNSQHPWVGSQDFGTDSNWKIFGNNGGIKVDGSLWTSYSNNNGEKGVNNSSGYPLYPTTTILGGTNWKSIASGTGHAVAIQSVDYI